MAPPVRPDGISSDRANRWLYGPVPNFVPLGEIQPFGPLSRDPSLGFGFREPCPGKPVVDFAGLREAGLRQYGPSFANERRCVVNQKVGENFEVENIWLRKCGAVRVRLS